MSFANSEKALTEVGHLYNGDGSFYATGRVTEVFTFDREFQSSSYEGFEELFAPGQDPTDPDEVPFDSFGFSGGPIDRLGFISPTDATADAPASPESRAGMDTMASRPAG